MSANAAKPLVVGDRVAVVATSSPVYQPERLSRGLAALRSAGFLIEWDPDVLTPRGYLAGSDTERARAFNRVLERSDIKGIFCTRGGYGATRMLDRINYEAARKNPKLLVGFSDVTALHLALQKHAGWASLSGPMVAEWGEISDVVKRDFLALARGATPNPLLGPGGERLAALREGSANGVLLGGNLSMVVRLIGTPYLPAHDGALLFLEEVGERPYRIDALFSQLRNAGILNSIGGLILGAFTGWESERSVPTLTPAEIFENYFRDARYPVATGLPYGHFPDRVTVPIGVRARLTVTDDSAELAVLEPVVR